MTSQKFNDLLRTLRQLFLFDRADLDFGLYRIMNARRAEIEDFLQNRLLPSVREDLGAVKEEELRQLEKQVEEAIQLTMEYGGKSREDAEQSEKVVKAKTALKEASDLSALEDQVYSLLVTFFSRYYDEGDFITKRRYSGPGRERYMIPYDGEEVKLVWANMDQYYIKSDEFLCDYRFRVPPLEEGQPAPKPEEDDRPTILFKLVAADVEKDNRKSTEGDRRFALAVSDENPIELSADKKLLTIPFSHSAHPKGTKQTDLLQEAEETLLQLGEQRAARQAELLDVAEDAVLNAIPESFLSHLRKAVPNKSDPKKSRTLLRFHLDQYAARNTYDYFIHKDLGGFLRRELDYFLKSEVLEIEDMVDQPEEIVRQTLRKTKAVRSIAEKIISFLGNLEGFQKKLWLKKKFVTEAHYCITLDRIIEHCPELLPEIAANDRQRKEWKGLFAIQEIEGYGEPLTPEFLSRHPFLSIDTANYSIGFKEILLAAISGLDSECGGLLINSDNFQAIRFLGNRYSGEIDQIYLDPPYNAKSSEILYKNTFKHSSWVSLIENRISEAKQMQRPDGVVTVAIDENEQERLGLLLNKVYPNHRKTCLTLVHNPGGIQGENFSYTHEYAYFVFPQGGVYIGKQKRDDADITPLRDWGGDGSRRETAANCFYPIYAKGSEIVGFGEVCADDFHPNAAVEKREDGTTVVYPIDSDGVERKWRFARQSIEKIHDELSCDVVGGEKQIRRNKSIYRFKTVWLEKKYNANTYGSKYLGDMFGRLVFSFPKSIHTVYDCLDAVVQNRTDAVILDFFAGSGTTGDAVLRLNRGDGGSRRYILVEQGEYFDTALRPRIQKSAYSVGWRKGVPTSRDTGISHCFKYLRLESYEDTLNNLILRRTEAQQAALDGSDSLKDEYLLGYFLEPESAGSMSLLNIERFSDPWNYKLNIATKTVGETRPQAVDLVETFNYLIGLKVDHIAARRTVRPDRGLTRDEDGQLTVKNFRTANHGDDGSWTFQLVSGETRSGQKTLIIWRTLSGNLEEDNAILEAFLTKLDDSPLKKDWDALYVNGDNTLQNLEIVAPDEGEEAGLPARVFKVRMIEEEFKRRMFAECE